MQVEISLSPFLSSVILCAVLMAGAAVLAAALWLMRSGPGP